MPRTSKSESPGCPPIRALTTDELGLIKVVESRGKPSGSAQVVDTWGPPEASRHVLLASMPDRYRNPVMAIACKNGLVELLNPLNGEVLATDRVMEAFSGDGIENGSSLAALHLFGKRGLESGSNTLLMCTEKGKACLRSIKVDKDAKDEIDMQTLKAWEIGCSGNVLCSSVDGLENHALFAGKGIEVNVWNLDTFSKIWTAKPPPSNSLGIFAPTWFTASTFLCKDDHRKIVAGTNNHQVRLYDISAQRRPVISVDFRESPIRAISEDSDGCTIYLGTGRGDLASFDMRTGKMIGCFLGKCSGSIRSIVKHPALPLIASCGLDRYVRFWDTNSRQLLSAVFLKQILTNVVLDINFSNEVNGQNNGFTSSVSTLVNDSNLEDMEESDGEEPPPMKIKKTKRKKKSKSTKQPTKVEDDIVDGDDLSAPGPQSPLQEKEHRRKATHKRRRKKATEGVNDGEICEL